VIAYDSWDRAPKDIRRLADYVKRYQITFRTSSRSVPSQGGSSGHHIVLGSSDIIPHAAVETRHQEAADQSIAITSGWVDL
jgi:hypothetical protein